MAIGDAVVVILAATETHQPAAGVENCITYIRGTNTNLAFTTNATTDNDIEGWDPAVGLGIDTHKLFINNTIFIELPASSAGIISGIVTNI